MKKLIPILLLAGATFLGGCGDSEDTNLVSGQQGNGGGGIVVPASPAARDDAYTATASQAITVNGATGVLANDTVNATNQSNVVVTFPSTTTQGGTLTQADNAGAFVYTPTANFVGTDTFTYTVSNGFATATATVTITVEAGQVATQGYFVDSVAGNDATGSFTTGSPFRTIQAAVTAAGANRDVVVRPGSYTGSVSLLNGQRLLGSGSTLVDAQSVARPVLTGPVILGDGNTLDFLRIAGTTGDAINGDDQDGATITNCEIDSAGNAAVSGDPAIGNWTVEGNTLTDIDGIAVLLSTVDGDMVARINRNNISRAGFSAISLVTSKSSEMRVQMNDNQLTGTAVPGATVEVISGSASTATLEIVGNKNDDVYAFGINTLAANINVENLATLETLNTGSVEITLGSVKGPNDIADAGF